MDKEDLKRAFGQINLVQCACGNFVSKKELQEGDGACFKCWEK